jgi:hypothetical protein
MSAAPMPAPMEDQRWLAVVYARFLTGHASFAALERWQTAYLPIYSAWAAFVVIAFPPLFSFI